MGVRSFLQLDREQQFQWIETLIMGQNPRLRVGERMRGPVGVFKNGVCVAPSDPFLPDALQETLATSTVQALSLDSPMLDGHPWLAIDVGTHNWLHLYDVCAEHPFTGFSAGDALPVVFGKTRFNVQLTEQIVIEHTCIVVRFALSK